MIPPEIHNAEVIDWWEAERAYVWNECSRQVDRLGRIADETIDDLSLSDALWFKSEARDDLKRKLGSEVELHNRRLARHLTASYEASRRNIEDLPELDRISTTEYVTAAAGVAAGAGAIGLAVGASAFIPATSTILFAIPVATFGSWPVVATLGVGALAAAWFSPSVATYANGMVRDRYKRAIRAALEKELLSEDAVEPLSSWQNFSSQLNSLAQTRMHR